jgi:NADH dehydrogenase
MTPGDRVVVTGAFGNSGRHIVETLARAIGVRRPIVAAPPALGHSVGVVLGAWLNDVIVTRDEIEGLMQGLLATDSPPVGRVRLSDWAREQRGRTGRRYATELGRRRDRSVAYVKAC